MKMVSWDCFHLVRLWWKRKSDSRIREERVSGGEGDRERKRLWILLWKCQNNWCDVGKRKTNVHFSELSWAIRRCASIVCNCDANIYSKNKWKYIPTNLFSSFSLSFISFLANVCVFNEGISRCEFVHFYFRLHSKWKQFSQTEVKYNIFLPECIN